MLTYSWTDFIQLASAIITVAMASGGATMIAQRIKEWLGLSGQTMQVVAWIIGGVLALLTAVVNGLITPELFTQPLVLIATILLVLSGSERLYQVRKAQQAKRLALDGKLALNEEEGRL